MLSYFILTDMNDKKFNELLKVHKIKRDQFKLASKESRVEGELSLLQNSYCFGSIWGIEDRSVPFDYNRKEDDYKDKLRPCAVVKIPKSLNSYALIETVPGTSKFHPIGEEFPPCLKAEVPPEELHKTTWFLVYMKFFSVRKKLEKRFCELSTESKNKLTELIEEI